jgi:transposase
VWLLLKEESELKPEEQLALQRMKQEVPSLELAITLAHEFRSMVQNRQVENLSAWLNRAMDSEIEAMKSFVHGLHDDLVAVEAALSLPWSNGVTEGQVNRLKLVKRKMYGRANFDLLRRRFLGMPAGP